MIPDILKYIACPYDRCEQWDIVIAGTECKGDAEIVCQACGRRYRSSDGILSMMPDAFSSDPAEVTTLKRIEQKVRDEGAEKYLAWFGPYTHYLEYGFLVGNLRPGADESLLDIGCGIGRITVPLASRVREIVAVDYSRQSLLLLRKTLQEKQLHNVLLLQADATLLPLKEGAFDKALSSQVITFVPTKEQRLLLQRQVCRALKDGAVFVFTVFNNHLYRKWKHRHGVRGVFGKEGTHPDLGFYYYNYGFKELKDELAALPYESVQVFGVCNVPREKMIDRAIKGRVRAMYLLDRLMSFSRISALLGDLLLARVVKRGSR